jgi:hypothetical protein
VDATIVSISRGQPRWRLPFKYRKLPALAPGDRSWNEEDQEAFERAYLDQLDALGAETILAKLEQIGGGRPVVMLCWERPEPAAFCHRWTLARFVEERTGTTVPELEHGMLAKKPTAQPVLFDD